VLESSQTGTTVNNVPMMKLRLRITQNGATREVTLKQLIDLGNIPRPGERVMVMVDKTHPDRVAYAGLATGEMAADADYLQDIESIPGSLLEHHTFAIATVRGVEPGQGPATRFTLEVDSIKEPKRTITLEQFIAPPGYQAGDRVYLLVGQDDPTQMALAPLELTGGKKIPPMANRLDPFVLGPQLLHEGKQAEGTVLAATQIPFPAFVTPLPQFPESTHWHMRFRVQPPGEASYEAELTISFTTQAKAERYTQMGQQLSLRCDWNDPQCICIDPIAMGEPDPYEAIQKMLAAKPATTGSH
jgi:hypothetical protein